MELIEINNTIEEVKTSYEMAKTFKEAAYYKTTLQELRAEKQEILKKEFKRR